MVSGKRILEIKLSIYLLAGVLVLGGVLLGYGYFLPVEVMINDSGLIYTVESRAHSVGDLLEEQKIEVDFHDKLYPGIYAPLAEGTEVFIERTVPVEINQPGVGATYYTAAATVGEFLEEMDIPLDGSFFVTPQLDDPVIPGMEINLVPRRVVAEFEQKKIPYETRKNEDNSLLKGKHLIVTEGRDGVRELEYRVVYAGEKEISRELVQERILKEPITAVVNIGTKVEKSSSQVVTASRGKRVQDYSNEGLASWYGADFQGRRTSSGEIYDQRRFTAAHRHLPFGTLVRVTFLRTGKSIEVTINDRGPLKNGRIIDLSGAAAEAIGLKPFGVGRVKIEVVK